MIRVRRRPRHSVARGSEMAGVAVTSLKGRISHGQQRIESHPGTRAPGPPALSVRLRTAEARARAAGRPWGQGTRGRGSVHSVLPPSQRPGRGWWPSTAHSTGRGPAGRRLGPGLRCLRPHRAGDLGHVARACPSLLAPFPRARLCRLCVPGSKRHPLVPLGPHAHEAERALGRR